MTLAAGEMLNEVAHLRRGQRRASSLAQAIQQAQTSRRTAERLLTGDTRRSSAAQF
jgi:hypothetical protein